jgi:hypothetical protein
MIQTLGIHFFRNQQQGREQDDRKGEQGVGGLGFHASIRIFQEDLPGINIEVWAGCRSPGHWAAA